MAKQRRPLDPGKVKSVPVDPTKAIKMDTALEKGDRITAILNIHHEQKGEQPISAACTFISILETQNQAMSRRLRVGTKMQPIEFGWLQPDSVGLIMIENRVGHSQSVLPTDEEMEQQKKQFLYVSTGPETPMFIIRPGRFMVFEMDDPTKLQISAKYEDTPFNIHLFPR